MASNYRQRSGSSDSRSRQERKARGASSSLVKGRPAASRSIHSSRPSRSNQSPFSPRGLRSDASSRSSRIKNDRSSRGSFGSTGSSRTGGTRLAARGASSRNNTTSFSSRTDASSYSRSNYGSGPSGYKAPEINSAPIHSVSVGTVTEAHRRSLVSKPRVPRALIVILILVATLAVAAVVIYNLRLFPVQKVTVSGVEHLTAQEMTDLAAVPQDSTLLQVDTAGVEGRLESNPWVKKATVERVFPDSINLKIEERSIAAICDVVVDDAKTQEVWALSSDGMWLMRIPDRNSPEAANVAEKVYEDADNVLKISGVPYGSRPEAGTMCTNANISNALSIIDGMSTELAEQVKSVTAASAENTTITLTNGVEIAFGDSSDIRDKERVCLQLMQEHPNKISYINVRVVNKPVWRSL